MFFPYQTCDIHIYLTGSLVSSWNLTRESTGNLHQKPLKGGSVYRQNNTWGSPGGTGTPSLKLQTCRGSPFAGLGNLILKKHEFQESKYMMNLSCLLTQIDDDLGKKLIPYGTGVTPKLVLCAVSLNKSWDSE